MVKVPSKNMVVSQEFNRKSNELSSLFEVAKQFLEIKELKSLKEQIVISSMGVLGAEGGTLLEFDPVENTLSIVASYGQNLEIPANTKFIFRKKWQNFLVGKNLGIPIKLSNLTKDSKIGLFVQYNLQLFRTVEPYILTPIHDEKKLLGILCLQKKLFNKNYSIEDFNLLTSMTTLAAKAWRNLISTKPSEKTKPVPVTRSVLTKLPTTKIRKEIFYLRKEHPILKQIVGESRIILSIFRNILEVAKTRCPVLILGKTGTGKELVARCVHQLSSRRDNAFVELNCASVPSELIESELFGYEKGAFTGATGERKGIFQQADNGTLFLDEIGDMSLNLQTKLLRVIQEGRFRRLGGEKNISADVRIMTASNKDLLRETRRGTFREDLFYRINVFPIYLASLEERKEDIPLLAEYFLKRTVNEFGLTRKSFSSDAIRVLKNMHYPGNVRELKNIVERVALRSGDEEVIGNFWLEQLSEESYDELSRIESKEITSLIFEAQLAAEEADLEDPKSGNSLADIERSHIKRILEKTNQNKTQAAKILGIPRSTLIGKMKKLGIYSNMF